METTEKEESSQERIPVFKSWLGWYGLLIGVLTVLIGLFYWFTIAFS